MSAAATERPYFVLVYATSTALAQAERLLPGRCLENLVLDGMRRGAKRKFLPRGVAGTLQPDERSVLVVGGILCVVRKTTGRLGASRAWLVLRLVEPKRGRRSA